MVEDGALAGGDGALWLVEDHLHARGVASGMERLWSFLWSRLPDQARAMRGLVLGSRRSAHRALAASGANR